MIWIHEHVPGPKMTEVGQWINRIVRRSDRVGGGGGGGTGKDPKGDAQAPTRVDGKGISLELH
ncbi:hypothetical protein MJO28_004207 [Puccinia striiformis f. sp. tritici]|uniref:Uncharacterized protein n=3 Tax=Puccinia striiformis TaxID=27350 RepID=A0A0L0V173_9BASI|nr:hypothetical protein Pst134EA_007193 [Puccinia striiformis f. sp. tritici]KAI9608476.1 hypothetical protein H4Q26_004658 [Puccinia striiformis f. sp. tritici PST-130]KNE93009.1 hypothetical protein PSTG_13584 [Puccinia striiformis f. sp. tritici PST-78]POV97967.1 hypothetical protein PSHT_14293 [Puccinia striiformis]KAH9469920.1 hypothetical protein Pst134EA_007193 [Puccinia striiformis f. sp. tritici]KAI7957112.1 hypothetical protein MJO28_004207 [Puccinia striiformis f. sp. tritici]